MFPKQAKEKTETQETETLVSGRYNLRRRKGQGDELLEQKKAEPIMLMATPQETSKTTDLEFGGRIGKLPTIILCSSIDSPFSQFHSKFNKKRHNNNKKRYQML